jgi:hypothetical protein
LLREHLSTKPGRHRIRDQDRPRRTPPALLQLLARALNGPRLVKGHELEGLDRAAATSEYVPLFSESEMGDFRSQWIKIQTCFVDEPRGTVKDADKLVAAVMRRLAEGFAN